MAEPRIPAMDALSRFAPAIELLLDRLSAAPARNAAGGERAFPVYDSGCLLLAVPVQWHEEFEIDGTRCSLVFREPQGAVTLRMETSVLSVQESLAFSVEDMRNEVQVAARAACAPGIQVFAGRHGGGFHFATVEPATGRRVMQGRFLARPLLFDFKIDAGSAGAARLALELVRGARAAAG